MKFYSFEQIKAANCCLRYAKEILPGLGYEVRGDRIQAKWRGGDGFNVAIAPEGWYDHKEKEGGSVISLCALTKFGGDTPENIQLAQDFLGSWLGIAPAIVPTRPAFDHRESPRYKELVANGYAETAHYDYTNQEGAVCFTVYRLEHPHPAPSQKRKDFVQCSPFAPSIKDAEKHLYNLPAIAESPWAIVVEGEKDADTLKGFGLPATTCNNGSANWRDEYTEELRGKDVVVCRDNDEAGVVHARTVALALRGVAKSLKVVCPSAFPKGDVTDWVEREKGSADKFIALVTATPSLADDDPIFSGEGYAIAAAKKANETAFANFTWGETIKNGRPVTEKLPRSLNDLVKDLNTRFLGFPRRLGERLLFDHDLDTNGVNTLESRHDLFAWISDKSKHNYEWQNGSGFVTREELFSAIVRRARRYEKVATVPTWPPREDTYEAFREELKPTPGHAAFNGFCEFFSPATEADALLLRCFVVAPLYYGQGVPRPCWIIDSVDAFAVGKTTLVYRVADLFKDSPISIDLSKTNFDEEKIMMRLISPTGRNSRIFLLDNLRGKLSSSFFASLVTAPMLSGRPPYGRGEETRPNDLTYVITSNSPNFDTDIATRAFILRLKSHPKTKDWERAVKEYTEKNRFAIFADMIDLMRGGAAPASMMPSTRFPVFEREVMWPICGGEEGYRKAISSIVQMRDEANVDNENCIRVGEIVRENIARLFEGQDPDMLCVFLRNEVVNLWLRQLNLTVQDVRNLIATKQIKCFSRKVRRYPRSCKSAPLSGILFIGAKVRPTPIVPVYRLRLDADMKKAEKYGDAPVDDTSLGTEIAELRTEECRGEVVPLRAIEDAEDGSREDVDDLEF